MVTVAVLVGVLVALGIVLTAMGVRLVRATRTDPAALGPLEVMSERHWQRSDADRRAEVLSDARPATRDLVAAGVESQPDAVELPAAAAVAARATTLEDERTGAGIVSNETADDQTIEVAASPAASTDPESPDPQPDPSPEPPTPPTPPDPQPPVPPEPPTPPEPVPPEPVPPMPVPQPPPSPPGPLPPVPGPPPEPLPEPIPRPPVPDPIPSPVPPQPTPPPPIPQVELSSAEEEIAPPP